MLAPRQSRRRRRCPKAWGTPREEESCYDLSSICCMSWVSASKRYRTSMDFINSKILPNAEKSLNWGLECKAIRSIISVDMIWIDMVGYLGTTRTGLFKDVPLWSSSPSRLPIYITVPLKNLPCQAAKKNGCTRPLRQWRICRWRFQSENEDSSWNMVV